MKLIKRYFRSSYKFKIITSFIAIAITPLCILIVLLYNEVVVSYQSDIKDSVVSDFYNDCDNINSEITKIYKFAYEIQANNILKEFFIGYNSIGTTLYRYRNVIEAMLNWQLITKPDIMENISIYTTNRNIPRSNIIYLMSSLPKTLTLDKLKENFKTKNLYVELLDIKNETPETSHKSGYYIYFPIMLGKNNSTIMEIKLNLDYIVKNMRSNKNYNKCYIVFEKNKYIYDISNKTFIKTSDEYIELIKENKKNYMVNYKSIQNDISLICKTDTKILLKSVSDIKFNFFSIISLGIIVLILIIYQLSTLLTKKITNVSSIIRDMDGENVNIIPNVEGNDEVDILIKRINQLTLKVKRLVEAKYKTEITIRKAEYKALQKQITPHFLYNTLENFKMLAVLNNQYEISKGLTSLGNLLRYYTTIGENFTSVKAEIKSIDDYINIQNITKKNSISFVNNINPMYYTYYMPSLIFQPIIENCIKHGFVKNEKLNITLDCICKEEKLIFIIKDDGVGIKKDKLKELNKNLNININEEDNQNKNIGLYNVNKRIKLLTGEQYGINIDDETKCGTTVIIQLPLIINSNLNVIK